MPPKASHDCSVQTNCICNGKNLRNILNGVLLCASPLGTYHAHGERCIIKLDLELLARGKEESNDSDGSYDGNGGKRDDDSIRSLVIRRHLEESWIRS